MHPINTSSRKSHLVLKVESHVTRPTSPMTFLLKVIHSIALRLIVSEERLFVPFAAQNVKWFDEGVVIRSMRWEWVRNLK